MSHADVIELWELLLVLFPDFLKEDLVHFHLIDSGINLNLSLLKFDPDFFKSGNFMWGLDDLIFFYFGSLFVLDFSVLLLLKIRREFDQVVLDK